MAAAAALTEAQIELAKYVFYCAFLAVVFGLTGHEALSRRVSCLRSFVARSAASWLSMPFDCHAARPLSAKTVSLYMQDIWCRDGAR